MSAAIMEAQLVRLVNSDLTLGKRGCMAARLREGGVAIDLNGRFRGSWFWQGTGFIYMPADTNQPAVEVMTAAEALIYTQGMTASDA